MSELVRLAGGTYVCPECDGRNRTAEVRAGCVERCVVCWSEGRIPERIAELYRAGGRDAVLFFGAPDAGA